MNRTFAIFLRRLLIVTLATVAISALLALIFLAVVPWLPDAVGNGRIQWDDHSIALSNVFSGGVVNAMFAFGAMTLAILVTIAAVIFSVLITVISLAAAVAALLLAAAIVGFPILLIGGIVWLVVRRNKRHTATVNPAAHA